MDKIAVIDMGTNSIRLLLADFNKGKIVNREKMIITTRLGEKVDESKCISKRAIKDTLSAIIKFNDLITKKNYSIKKIIGTSALRDAKNSHELIDVIKDITGQEIDIIDGKTEAKYGFSGVINSFNFQKKSFVIDIGGGSTELILGSKKIDLLTSLDIGAVRMTDRYIENDIPTKVELEKLRDGIDKIIDEFIIENKGISFGNVIGIGGTITTLAAVKYKMDVYNSDIIQGSSFNRLELNAMIDEFSSLDLEKRKEILGLQPKRADIILAGSIILERLFEKFQFEEIIVSDYDNLEGIIFDEHK